jgi:hypothetical protein
MEWLASLLRVPGVTNANLVIDADSSKITGFTFSSFQANAKTIPQILIQEFFLGGGVEMEVKRHVLLSNKMA